MTDESMALGIRETLKNKIADEFLVALQTDNDFPYVLADELTSLIRNSQVTEAKVLQLIQREKQNADTSA